MKRYIVITLIFFTFILIQCARQDTIINKLVINSFIEDSYLQEAGALEGDIIVQYDGKTVKSQAHLIELKNKLNKTEVEIVLLRDGEKIKLQVPAGTLGATLKEFLPDHKPADDAVLIEDIGKLNWGIGMDNSFLACAFLLEQKYGNKLSYADLLGISGYGFKLNFFDRYCPSSPDATVGFDSGGYLLKKLGYSARYYHLLMEGDFDETAIYKSEDEMRQLIRTSLDNGWPVIAIDLIEAPEWGLITGYQKGGEEFFCRTYFDKTEGYEIAQNFPWVILVIDGKKETEIKPLYSESLKLAEEMYKTPVYRNYFSGITALEEWIKALKDENYYTMNTDELNEISHANWWTYVSLEIARGVCNQYLSENVDKFETKPELINQLAQIYKSEADLLVENYDVVPNQFGSTPQFWSSELRAKQIIVMEELLVLEEKALKLLKQINATY